MNRNGSIAIIDDKGREKERYAIVYGAKLRVEDGAQGRARRHARRVGPVHLLPPYGDRRHRPVQGPAGRRHPQRRSRRSHRPLAVSSSPTLPMRSASRAILIKAVRREGGNKRYLMPSRAHLMVADGDEVFPGDVLAKIPRETTRTKDITGGLPRVVELFEARKPRDPAIISKIDGVVRFGEVSKGQRKVYVTADNGQEERVHRTAWRLHQRPGRRACTRRRCAHRRSAQPARHSGGPRRARAAAVPRQRDPGGLPPAGRRHLRQAHRDHRSPDASLGQDRGGRRHLVPARAADRPLPVQRRRITAC